MGQPSNYMQKHCLSLLWRHNWIKIVNIIVGPIVSSTWHFQQYTIPYIAFSKATEYEYDLIYLIE